MKELLSRLHYLLHRRRFERELDEEIRLHLTLRAEDSGSPHAAMRQFGNVTYLKEESRNMWTWTFLEQLSQDIRYGLRTMAANLLFTGMAVLSLALGIGANTAIYSFVDAILLRSLPVSQPGQLVVLRWRAADMPAVVHGMMGSRYRDGAGTISPNFPYPAFLELASRQTSLTTLFAYATAWRTNLVVREQAEVVDTQLVSGGYFRSVGVAPAIGRLIADADDRPSAPPVAVISHALWQRRFAANPAAIGQPLRINNVVFTIVGVAPPAFFGLDPAAHPPVYVSLHAAPLLAPNPAEDEDRRFVRRSRYWVEMMGRLRPGVSLTQAETELSGQFRQYVESTITSPKENTNLPVLRLESAAGGLDSLRRQYSEPVYALMAMVALILAIACVNIANLMLARAAARRREMAVRLSLGAGRLRVLRQLLTESVLLSLFGAVLGLSFAFWGIRGITWLIASGREDFTFHASLNWTVLAFTFALALATGILFGLAPAVQATRVDVAPALKASRSGDIGRTHRFRLSRVLVAAQVALSLLLVIAGGLFTRTLSNLYSVDLGFNRENLLLFTVNARQAGFKDAGLAQLYAGFLERFRQIPGVRSAGLSQNVLVSGNWNSSDLFIPGAPPASGAQPETCVMAVDPGFLATMQIPIIAGVGMEERHLSSPRVAVVTEAFAKKFFPGEVPIGRHIGLDDRTKSNADIEIIGVARTTLYNTIKEEKTPPVVYVPYTQKLENLGRVSFELRATGDPLSLVPAVREIVRQASPDIPLAEVTTQTARIDDTISRERTFAHLCTGFAALSLIIACIGLYGTTAYGVARRTSEIGIRVALGATRPGIVWMVLREVMLVASIGLAIGAGLAWWLARFIESYLFAMKRHDPSVYLTSILILAVAAALAAFVPARRAARIDPMRSLRQE